MITATIQAKRDGKVVNAAALKELVAGLVTGEIADSQAAAFAMAVCIRGMNVSETATLTKEMAQSGEQISWDEQSLGGPVLDKHSSGGVGDKVSILLAPIVAACGGYVPMISGRSLGHTGGTLDKLSAIPGYQIDPSSEVFRATVKQVGCAIIGATKGLAPADKRLYAIRDITATVSSVPLITASILSKKLAAGVRRLVIDIKIGTGAFMKQLEDGRELAKMLVQVAGEAGMELEALLTDMNEPLGRNVGNALEVREVAEILTDHTSGDPRLIDLTVELAARMLVMGGIVTDKDAGRQRAAASITNGSAAQIFNAMIAALGGAPNFLENYDRLLPQAAYREVVRAEHHGWVAAINVQALGEAVMTLVSGQSDDSTKLDLGVGLADLAGRGVEVGPQAEDRPLAEVHARDATTAAALAQTVRQAYRIEATPLKVEPCVLESWP